MDWQGESYSLNNPVATLEDWVAQQGGALDLLNDGLSPSALFLEATPERRVVDLPTGFASMAECTSGAGP